VSGREGPLPDLAILEKDAMLGSQPDVQLAEPVLQRIFIPAATHHDSVALISRQRVQR
jgi:hypothetical protein